MDGVIVLLVVTLVQINIVCLVYQGKTIVKAIYHYMKLFVCDDDVSSK